MDLDIPGSEDILFNQIEADTWQIINAIQAVRPDIEVLLSSYDYPNFNVTQLCSFFACPKREDLSRDPVNDLITDAELNEMMVNVEQHRVAWTNTNSRVHFDNSIGLMHYFYGDGVSAPGTLPYPGQDPPAYLPLPGGNPLLPTLRENFRPVIFIVPLDADPIHLDYDGYQYKVSNQVMSYFFPRFRGQPRATFFSLGSGEDGWTDGAQTGTNYVTVGSTGGNGRSGLISYNTSSLPDNAVITGANLYLMRQNGSGTSPFQSGALGNPVVDIAKGSFGAPIVEAADAAAVADAANAGCATGTVRKDDYALRINLTADGLDAINLSGRTQFRLSFSSPSGASNVAVDFSTGDGLLATGAERLVTHTRKVVEQMPDGRTVEVLRSVVAIEHQGLAEYMGSPRPFLDVQYCLPEELGCETTQDILLSAGWNLISSYIEPLDPTLETVLDDIKNDMILIKNDEGQVYWPAQNFNSILDWDVHNGYQIILDNPATLSLTGQQVDPAQTALELTAGWHTVAYLRSTPMPIAEALDSISNDLYLVKNGDGHIYWPAYAVNQIGQMQPDAGYNLYLSSAGTLIYPAN